MRHKSKPFKVGSLSNVEDAKIVADTPKPTPLPKIEAEMPKKAMSPFLSEPIDIMEHATGNINVGGAQNQFQTPQQISQPAPQSAPIPQPAPGGFKVDSDFFAPKTAAVPNLPPLGPDAPEQSFVPVVPGSAGSGSGTGAPADEPIDSAVEQSAKEFSETMTEIYKRLVPEITDGLIKIKEGDLKAIKNFEKSGDMLPGTAESLSENNKLNRERLNERAKMDASMLKKPLAKSLAKLFAEKKGLMSPYTELMLVVVVIAVTYFFLVKEIKSSNNNLLSKIYEKIDSFKKQETDIPLKDMPLTSTEEVKK